MRAMPSPADRTTPVSWTSSCFSYSRICSRMMSLISAARICMTVLLPDLALAALGHLAAHSEHLRAKTSIPDCPPDVEHDATEQLRVHLGGDHHLAGAGEPLRQLGQLGLLGGAERRGRPDARSRSSQLLVDQRLVGLGHLAQQLEPTAVREELDEVADLARDAERGDDLADDLAACAALDGWIQHHRSQPRFVERGGGVGELLAARVERPGLASQLQQRPRISPGEVAAHDACLTDSRNSRTKRAWSSGVRAARTSGIA